MRSRTRTNDGTGRLAHPARRAVVALAPAVAPMRRAPGPPSRPTRTPTTRRSSSRIRGTSRTRPTSPRLGPQGVTSYTHRQRRPRRGPEPRRRRSSSPRRSSARSPPIGPRPCTRSTPGACARSRSACGRTSTRLRRVLLVHVRPHRPELRERLPVHRPSRVAHLLVRHPGPVDVPAQARPGRARSRGSASSRRGPARCTSPSTGSASCPSAPRASRPRRGPAARRRQPHARRRPRLRDASCAVIPWDMSQPSDIGGPANMIYGFNGTLLNGLNVGGNRGDAHFSLPLAGPIDGEPIPPPELQGVLRRAARPRFRTRGRHGRALDLGDRGRAGRLAGQRRHHRVSGLERHLRRPGDVPTLGDHRPRQAEPHRVGRPADHRGAVRSARGHRRAALPRRRHQDRRGPGRATAAATTSASTTTRGEPARPPTSTSAPRVAASAARGSPPASRSTRASTRSAGHRIRCRPATSGCTSCSIAGRTWRVATRPAPLRMTASPSPRYGVNPFGSLESLTARSGGVRARGWAIDPDTKNAIRGALLGRRPPVHRGRDRERRPPRRPARRIRASAARTASTRSFRFPREPTRCTRTRSTSGAGTNRQLGCRTVTVRANPFGSLDSAVAKVGHAQIRGWAVDPNRLGPIDVHVYVDGKMFTAITADDNRPDIVRRSAGLRHRARIRGEAQAPQRTAHHLRLRDQHRSRRERAARLQGRDAAREPVRLARLRAEHGARHQGPRLGHRPEHEGTDRRPPLPRGWWRLPRARRRCPGPS